MKKIFKNLAKIVFLSTIPFLLNSCNSHEKYHYDGYIGEQKVVFSRSFFDNVLDIEHPNGFREIYADERGNDLKIERADYYIKNKSGEWELIAYKSQNIDLTRYNLVNGKFVKIEDDFSKGQKVFDNYLQKIKEKKIKQGLWDVE